ncbi:YybH family protein [Bauldia sp.]|uniref:YybH family protein n=1 Tax=Bauldia sp. TaxID=2575872 RepID=UPI003BA9216B
MADDPTVHAAVDAWIAALNAMLNGDAAPFAEVYSHADDASYMSAEGTFRVGWSAIEADWKAQAEKALGGNVRYSDLHTVVDGDMAVAQYRLATSVTGPDGKTSDVAIRETNVFRKEDGRWKMIAHQADDFTLWEQVVDRS